MVNNAFFNNRPVIRWVRGEIVSEFCPPQEKMFISSIWSLFTALCSLLYTEDSVAAFGSVVPLRNT